MDKQTIMRMQLEIAAVDSSLNAVRKTQKILNLSWGDYLNELEWRLNYELATWLW